MLGAPPCAPHAVLLHTRSAGRNDKVFGKLQLTSTQASTVLTQKNTPKQQTSPQPHTRSCCTHTHARAHDRTLVTCCHVSNAMAPRPALTAALLCAGVLLLACTASGTRITLLQPNSKTPVTVDVGPDGGFAPAPAGASRTVDCACARVFVFVSVPLLVYALLVRALFGHAWFGVRLRFWCSCRRALSGGS